MRRQERLFAIVEYLRGRRTGTTAEAMAERFGVTVRTIYRDLETLRMTLPLQAERGRGGGYALDRSYTLPPVNFTAREAALLITVGEWATTMRLLPFATTLYNALDKVRGALPASSQRILNHLRKRLSFVGIPALPSLEAVRETIEQAWFEHRTMKICYRSPRGNTSVRTIRILNIVMDRGVTLLNCEDLEKNETRQFRLDRIVSANIQ